MSPRGWQDRIRDILDAIDESIQNDLPSLIPELEKCDRSKIGKLLSHYEKVGEEHHIPMEYLCSIPIMARSYA